MRAVMPTSAQRRSIPALKRDFRVWRDTRDVPPEQDFTAEIEKAIKAAGRLVVCVTPDVEREDSFVRREIAYAQLKKPLLVARLPMSSRPSMSSTIRGSTSSEIGIRRSINCCAGCTAKRWKAQRPGATRAPAVDRYRSYVERLYGDVVESLRVRSSPRRRSPCAQSNRWAMCRANRRRASTRNSSRRHFENHRKPRQLRPPNSPRCMKRMPAQAVLGACCCWANRAQAKRLRCSPLPVTLLLLV